MYCSGRGSSRTLSPVPRGGPGKEGRTGHGGQANTHPGRELCILLGPRTLRVGVVRVDHHARHVTNRVGGWESFVAGHIGRLAVFVGPDLVDSPGGRPVVGRRTILCVYMLPVAGEHAPPVVLVDQVAVRDELGRQ